MNPPHQSLPLRAFAMADSASPLQKSILQRRAAEAALRRAAKHHARRLAKSRGLQRRLRHLAHKLLSTQETQRHKLSRQLQDDIGQILLGINIQLLALEAAVHGNPATLKKEIANLHRRVKKTIQFDCLQFSSNRILGPGTQCLYHKF